MSSKFLTESTGEKIVKIGQYLTKIWTKYDSLVFWATLYIVGLYDTEDSERRTDRVTWLSFSIGHSIASHRRTFSCYCIFRQPVTVVREVLYFAPDVSFFFSTRNLRAPSTDHRETSPHDRNLCQFYKLTPKNWGPKHTKFRWILHNLRLWGTRSRTRVRAHECIKTAERIIEILSPPDRPIILVFRQQGLFCNDRFTPNEGPNTSLTRWWTGGDFRPKSASAEHPDSKTMSSDALIVYKTLYVHYVQWWYATALRPTSDWRLSLA